MNPEWIQPDGEDFQILDDTDTGHTSGKRDGRLEYYEQSFIERMVWRYGIDAFVDVGARCGWHGLHVLDQTKTLPVHFVEANTDHAELIRTSLAENGWSDRATVHPVAAWHDSDSHCLVRDAEHGVLVSKDSTEPESREEESFETRALADLLDDGTLGIKIDTEGAEENVLFGLRNRLSDLQFASVEYHPDRVSKKSLGRVTALLSDVAGLTRLGVRCNPDGYPIDPYWETAGTYWRRLS